MLAPTINENGENEFIGTKEEWESASGEINEVYVCIETNSGKTDNFFKTIKAAQEFLSTYE